MSVRKVKKGDINDFKCGMVVGDGQAAHNCCSGGIFTRNQHQGSHRMVPRGENKHPVSGSCVDSGVRQQKQRREEYCR